MFTALFTSALLLGAAPKVVSPEWNAVNVKRELVTFYADVLADALRKEGLQVVTAQDVATLLGMERQRELLGCNDGANSCMAELASALGCDATLVVNLARFDDGGFRGIAKVISSKTGNTLSSAQLDSRNERTLLDSLESAAKVLAVPFKATVTPVVEVKQAPVASSGPVPVWWIPGAIGVAAGGASVAMFVASQHDFDTLYDNTDRTVAEAQAKRGAGLQIGGWVAAGVGVGLVVTSVVLLALPKSDVVPTAVVTPNGGAVGVGGRF